MERTAEKIPKMQDDRSTGSSMNRPRFIANEKQWKEQATAQLRRLWFNGAVRNFSCIVQGTEQQALAG